MGEQIAPVYSNCGSEPFSYSVVMVDCAGRLVVGAFHGFDHVVIDAIQPYGCPQAECQTLSNAFLKYMKTR